MACGPRGGRRVAGVGLLAITGLISFYPLVADWMPALISGMSIGLRETAAYHAMSSESLIGCRFKRLRKSSLASLFLARPFKAPAGAFFYQSCICNPRTGAGWISQVAIFASGLMGSMSGSVVTNVMTTGRSRFRPCRSGLCPENGELP